MATSLAGIRVSTIESTELCDKHGVHKIYYGKMKPFCPICQQEKMEQEKNRLVVVGSKQIARNFMERTSLVDDKSVWQASFDNYRAPNGSSEQVALAKARKLAGKYLKEPNSKFNTVFTGYPGSGKTHLAISMIKGINEYSHPQQRCLFLNVLSLLTEFKDGFSNPNNIWTEKYLYDLLHSVDVLVLDDLGSESFMNSSQGEATNWVQSVLYNITNMHHRIIITTNLTYNELKKAYNPKIVSRLLWNAKDSIVDFTKISDKRF